MNSKFVIPPFIIPIFILVILLLVLPVFAIYPGDPNFKGCVIGTDNGALSDVDCDRTPDHFDNCPFTSNPNQIDRDMNGYADVCDLVIDDIGLQPETPIQGRSLIATVSLMNFRPYPMRNMNLKMEIPKFGLSMSEEIAIIQPGERITKELLVRIPDCAPTKYTDVVIIAEYSYAPGQKEVFSQALKVPIVSSGLCAQETGGDKTIINILDIQDVDQVSGALYLFTIHNNQQESKAYILGIENIEDWGYSELHPGTVLVIPAGETRDGAIQVWARPGVSGRKTFLLTVQAKDDAKQLLLQANIPEQQLSPTPTAKIVTSMVGFLIIIFVVGIIIALVRKKKE